MKKRLAAIFAATAILGVTTAFAANPFSDVTPQDWAYQSVAQLAAAGVINGYPDGTFKGQNNITRFEMAQMVAKAMANEARANAEQQAMINRLADEFSSELNNLGVRVSNLENKVGNVKVTGDARLRYRGYEKDGQFKNTASQVVAGKKSMFDYRARINFAATVNDNTTVNVRVATLNNNGTSTMTEFGDATASKLGFDRVNVVHNFGKNTSLTVGRYGEFIGAGLMLDDAFDGAKLAYTNDKVNLSASYGSLSYAGEGYDADTNAKMTILQASGKVLPSTTLGAIYILDNDKKQFTGAEKAPFTNSDVYGFNLNTKVGKTWVGGEYVNAKDYDNGTAWVAGIGYGTYNQAKQGTWGLKAQYFDEDVNAPVYSSTWAQPKTQNYKAWAVTAQYALFNNVGLSAFYFFNGEDQKGNDVPDFYRAQVDFKF